MGELKQDFEYLEVLITIRRIAAFKHLLGVEVHDYSKNAFDNCFVRNFDETDLLNVRKGFLKLSHLRFIDEVGNALDYLEYMSKYYPDQYDIAENQYVIHQ